METTYKDCQSCGMPMKRDALGGGTNADGSKSAMYCSHCYREGQFTLPDVTATQMQQLVVDKLKEFGFPRFLGRMMARNVPKLARWNASAT